MNSIHKKALNRKSIVFSANIILHWEFSNPQQYNISVCEFEMITTIKILCNNYIQ